jgi:hypothetical protein
MSARRPALGRRWVQQSQPRLAVCTSPSGAGGCKPAGPLHLKAVGRNCLSQSRHTEPIFVDTTAHDPRHPAGGRASCWRPALKLHRRMRPFNLHKKMKTSRRARRRCSMHSTMSGHPGGGVQWMARAAHRGTDVRRAPRFLSRHCCQGGDTRAPNSHAIRVAFRRQRSGRDVPTHRRFSLGLTAGRRGMNGANF